MIVGSKLQKQGRENWFIYGATLKEQELLQEDFKEAIGNRNIPKSNKLFKSQSLFLFKSLNCPKSQGFPGLR